MLGEKSFHVSNGTVRRRRSACFLLHCVHAAASRAELLPRASLPRRRPPPPPPPPKKRRTIWGLLANLRLSLDCSRGSLV